MALIDNLHYRSRINEKIRNASFPERRDYYKGLKEEAHTSFILIYKLLEFNSWAPKKVIERHNQMINEMNFKYLV